MNLSGYEETRRLQELERQLVVHDPDLASMLSTGLSEPESPALISARRPPHGPAAGNADTASAMLIALFVLGLLVLAAMALS